MWHRGDRAKARDLYDPCAVDDEEPGAIIQAAPFFDRHGATFLSAMHERAEIARLEFAQIDSLGRRRDFDECLAQAERIIERAAGQPRPG